MAERNSFAEARRELDAITEQLVSGGYDATEGELVSRDTTWTDFGIVCGMADRCLRIAEQAARVINSYGHADDERWWDTKVGYQLHDLREAVLGREVKT